MSSKINTGEVFKGFKVQSKEWISDLKSHIFYLKHMTSGAKLIFIENKDTNKAFSIAFKTPPYDDTGVFHIFEHSVLAGSKRYPSKSLFFDLYASSLASHLNASTHPVFTQYYYASKLKKDFLNLFKVYLDAVFYPNVVKNPKIIKREGFRIEWNEKTKNFQYNGIVFSEMKGVFAEPLRHLYNQVMKSLLFQTPYAFDSGGDPEKIIQLNFQQIKEAHSKYYHPDNSLIYLYGNLEIKKILSTLHEEFLKHFKKRKNPNIPELKTQKVFKPHSIFKSTYPVLNKKETKQEEKTFISLNYVLGKNTPLETLLSLEILGSVLFNEENSPGKKKVRNLKLAKDISFNDFETQENVVCILLEGVASSKNQKKIKTLIESVFKDAYKKGLPPKWIESNLNAKEFSLKEALFNSPNKGLGLRSYVLNQWVQEKKYNFQKLKNNFEFIKKFSNVRKKLKNPLWIQTLIKKYFLDNTKKSFVLLSPNSHLIKELNQKINLKMKKELQIQNTEKLKKEDLEFKVWQNTKEPESILKKTPRLNPASLFSETEKMNLTKKIYKKQKSHPFLKAIPTQNQRTQNSEDHFLNLNTLEIYSFPQNTGGINYIDLHFDLSHLQEKNLYDLPLILYLLQKINTKKRNFSELTQALNENIGDLSFYVETFTPMMHLDPSQKTKKQTLASSKLKLFYPHLIVSSKFLNQKSSISFELIEETLTQSLFEPEHQVKSLILELINDKKTSLTDRASYLASVSGEAFFSESAKWMTYVDGHMAEIHLRNLEQKIRKDPKAIQKIIQSLKKTFSILMTQDNLRLLLLIGEKEHLKSMNTLSQKLISHFNPISKKKSNPYKSPKKANLFKNYKAIDGFAIPSPVQYNHMKIPYFQLKTKWNGKRRVFSRVLIFEYLIKVLREQNGAYGANAKWSSTDILSLSSYRDPKLKNTFHTFETIPDFFDHFKFNQKKLNAFIVGALTPYYTPKSPYDKARDFIDKKLIHRSETEDQKMKKEILLTKVKDIQKIAKEIKKILPKAKKTLAGEKEKITQEAPFIKKTLSL